jgi:hypothetical protein
VLFQILEKFQRGLLSGLVTINRPFFEIKKIRKYTPGVFNSFSVREPKKLLCDLIMVEGKNDFT